VVVELYLGNPLFPGADNLDQLYRIFNILGDPTDASWPAGARKYRELGFKGEARQRRAEEFGLRSLLKACGEGLVSLLERMLVLNPKKRISAREIVMDGYFSDVKTIIPPAIYKRFEKDHLLKKTTSKEAIENAESFIHQTRSKLSKLQEKEDPSQHPSVLLPAHQQQSTNNSTLNMALSPRKTSLQEEELRVKEQEARRVMMGIHALSPKHQGINALRPPH
jgi:serine/threonine protein kinase